LSGRGGKRKWHNEGGRRICSICELEKDYSEYYLRDNGSPKGTRCKECVLKQNRSDSMDEDRRKKRLERQKSYNQNNKEANTSRLKEYYKSKWGRAKSMMKTAKRRSGKFKEETDLTDEIIFDMLESQDCCSVTGIAFDFNSVQDMKCNPFAPSIDRIDPSIGYLKSNVRLVIWQYNLMKGEISDELLFMICKEVINGREKMV
jgi:hypothetical protein